MTQPPAIGAAIIPVTPLQQNCTLLWCKETMRGAFVDPGGDRPKLIDAARRQGVTVEKLILTHGHIDHCGEAGLLAEELGVPIEGPHAEDAFWIAMHAEVGPSYGMPDARPFTPDRWLDEGDVVTVGDASFAVYHTPGHTPGHVIFHHAPTRIAIMGDVLFQGSVGRTDFPRGDMGQLIESIRTKLWPLGDETRVLPGHGAMTTIGAERRTNPFVGDKALAA
jgi:glyoxylase-like metal-dependent hydrolase (beta-lactamase superfamily II)